MSKSLLFLALTLVLIAWPSDPAMNAVKPSRLSDYYPIHQVVKGDSLTSLASQYYGAPWKYVYLTSINKIGSKKSLPLGKKMKIPNTIIHTVEKGDTLSQIAKHYYKSSQLTSFIRWGNKMKDKEKIRFGQKLRIPFVLKHRVQKGENLAQISQRYYRTNRMSKYLREWNKLKDSNELSQRKNIWLAVRSGIVAPKVSADGEEASSKRVAQKERRIVRVPKGYDLSSMILATELVNEAQYTKALTILQGIPLSEFRRRADRRDYYWNMTLCFIALGRNGEAKLTFRRYITAGGTQESIEPSFESLSPKIKQVIGPMLVQKSSKQSG